MSVLIQAANQLKADVGGVGHGAQDATGPVREPVRLVTTDLGNIEHIIGGGGLTHLTESVSTALTKASDSIRGPNGGLLPSFHANLQHAGTTKLYTDALQGTTAVRSLGDRLRASLAMLRARLAV